MRRTVVADTQLYKRLCPLVRPSVRPSVVIESKSVKTRIYDAAVMIICVCVREHRVGEGKDGSCMPLPTRPQR